MSLSVIEHPFTIQPWVASSEDDYETLAQVHQQSLECAWSAQSFKEIVSLPTVTLRGAFDSLNSCASLIGFICFQNAGGVCDLLTLCVLPLYRHRGIGSQLMEAMFHACASQEETLYTLEVAQDNPQALRLYERWGFTIRSIRPQYYRTKSGNGVSAYIMTRSVMNNDEKTPSLTCTR